MSEAMVVSHGHSSSIQSIKGVCEERWNLLCCGVREEVI
ncbi:unnamed protein product [Brassica rapa]|uniref:Uncharacterized protein n=1 Tax=Brassica campestris TaxID=3711 RepID=A0A8D9H8L6_BRACM|nr:unnamed protein product [Brassica rapa]